jgi:hypothetical protein
VQWLSKRAVNVNDKANFWFFRKYKKRFFCQ